ncbi:SDR family oxidoreductase [Kitasatospora viridis]|uniref:NAD(P)-dependent dehydrogenase (Short-subunit alcohol dehydrogenase family) n=1 Tax=Kitasatospora viridis TaxID=281105 RepID=A0A561SG32_9ACTN|nr:SDR family oxidoreductase [Kitasatospora viridis]TWF73841.1 NAD(P)-dependent dehydrogenase (short-subunit alcohol dehydrogenase family) [Kitasatospora viridis]
MNGYAGRKAVITGGTMGMGLATAKVFVEGGGEVVVTGRNAENLAAAQAELGAKGHVVKSDTAVPADIDALGGIVEEKLGRIDLLFVNAGFAQLGEFGRVTEELFDATFGVNAKGAYFTAQRLAPLVNDGGAIVFTTSIANESGTPGMGPYGASKAAVRSFAKVIAAELLPRNIRVNAVSPGFIDTPTGGITGAAPEMLRAFAKLGDELTPMGRHGSAEEVARAVLFLAFEATFTTGAELTVDGGLGQRISRPQGR